MVERDDEAKLTQVAEAHQPLERASWVTPTLSSLVAGSAEAGGANPAAPDFSTGNS
jgi:hypothetical protein